jgi:hypothetical protein
MAGSVLVYCVVHEFPAPTNWPRPRIASHELAIGHGAAMSSLLPRTGHGLLSHLAKAKPAVAGAPAVQAAGGGGAAGGRWVLSWAWVRV